MTEARLFKHDKTTHYIERNNRSALLFKEHATLLENNISFTSRKVVDGAINKFQEQLRKEQNQSPHFKGSSMTIKADVSGDFSRKLSKELHTVDSDLQKAPEKHVHYLTIVDHKKMRYLVGSQKSFFNHASLEYKKCINKYESVLGEIGTDVDNILIRLRRSDAAL